jgi:hypothetical protein
VAVLVSQVSSAFVKPVVGKAFYIRLDRFCLFLYAFVKVIQAGIFSLGIQGFYALWVKALQGQVGIGQYIVLF